MGRKRPKRQAPAAQARAAEPGERSDLQPAAVPERTALPISASDAHAPAELAAERLPRRGLLRWLLGTTAGLGTLAVTGATSLFAAAIGRFMAPNVVSGPSPRCRVGRVSDFPLNQVNTSYRDRYGIFVVRCLEGGREQIVALRTRCTHLGCITQWNTAEGRFQCPCHGSAFSVDGRNIAGPAPRPLERCAIRRLDDGEIEVDISRIFRQERGQWSNPESFVLV